MIGLVQRVRHARVDVDDKTIGEIGAGIVLLLGVQKHDDEVTLQRLLQKLLNYRIFADDQGRMNLSLLDVQGQLLVVSQFTLAADTQKGTRPGFSRAAAPEHARELYELFCQKAGEQVMVQTGEFCADMQVSLQNDGPVTFWLEV